MDIYVACLFVVRLSTSDSSDDTILELPNGLNAMQSRSLSIIAPARWNIMPYYLRTLKSPRTFSYCLKD